MRLTSDIYKSKGGKEGHLLHFKARRKYIAVCLSLYEVPQRVSVSGITYAKFPAVKPQQ